MKLKFNITGMTCAACSARVEKVTQNVDGVSDVQVNLLSGTMTLHADDASIAETVISRIHAAGYGAALQGDDTPKASAEKDSIKYMKQRLLVSFAFLAVLMYFTMGHMIGLPMPHWYHGLENALVAVILQFVLTLPVVFINRAYYTKGLKALYNRAPNMDTLIAVGSGASLIYGVVALFRMAYAVGHGQMDIVKHYSENLYFESAAMILTLITLGKFLETRAKGKTGNAIRQLMDLSPKSATVRRDGREFIVPIEQVCAGDIVIVRSGGSVPVDGTIVSGRGAVDQSALTGESVPVEKKCGDSVAAATINTEGYFELRADRIGEDTTFAQIIRLVEEAGGSKAPIARLADKVAGIFVPAVMAIATVTFAVWMLAGKGVEFSLTMGIAVLVISCPCALGLATPVAIMVATGRGAQMGVLYKNAEALENLHNVDTVVLDKTGTLTAGRPAVTDVIPNAVDRQTLLSLAATVESKSEHPFAKAILDFCKNIPLKEAEDFVTLPGQGVSAVIDGTRYFGGNLQLMTEKGIVVPDYNSLAVSGKTPLYFASQDGTYLGMIAAADVLKADSADAVQSMQHLGLDVVMLTGDNQNTATHIANSAGVQNVIADVLPQDKASVIADLRRNGKKVLMIGDGINDAPALKTADVGMAIGTGTDIAMESADIVLMGCSLKGVYDAISLSRKTIQNIRQNLFWAFFYNVLGIPIAAGVLYPAFGIQLSPMIGAAAMSMSSVFVVTNALRLRLFKSGNSKIDINTKQLTKGDKCMETVIYVEGMMCSHCKARVESVCKSVNGTTDAVVDLQKKTVTVTGTADVNALRQAITDAGYEVKD